MIRQLAFVGTLSLSVVATGVRAQSVTLSNPTTNVLTAHAVHTAGNAVGLAPTAHEVPAQAVGRTVPAALPFAQGVTAAGQAVSGGITKTGDNIQHNGLTVAPTGAVSTGGVQGEQAAIKGVVTQTGSVAKQAATLPK
jgi:hypothetical protein